MSTWKCGARRDFQIDAERDWDGDGAKGRLWDHYGWKDNDPPSSSGGDTRDAFLLYDADAADQKGSYALPFADVVDGRVVALASGLRAAASRLPQKDGVSDDERNKARDVLDAYFEKLHEQQETEEDGRATSLPMLTTMGIRKTAVRGSDGGLPPELLKQVYDSDILEDTSLFLFTAAASTGQVDTYHTRMLPSTLKNFAADAQSGLSLQNSHRVDELPFGRTFDGRYVGPQRDGMNRAEFDIYMPHGVNLNGIPTDDVIRGVKLGVIRDVSVGFYGGTVRCSICGKDMFTDLFGLLFFGFPDDEEANDPDAPCYHMPGIDYPELDRKGARTGDRVTAIGEIDGAHCAELSLVFDGATPGAAIINGRRSIALAKAEQMAHVGVLSRHQAAALMSRYPSVRSKSVEGVLRHQYRLGGSRTGVLDRVPHPAPATASPADATATRDADTAVAVAESQPTVSAAAADLRTVDVDQLAEKVAALLRPSLTEGTDRSDEQDTPAAQDEGRSEAIEGRCERCGLPYQGREDDPLCGNCRKSGPLDGGPVTVDEGQAEQERAADSNTTAVTQVEVAGEAESSEPPSSTPPQEAMMARSSGAATEAQVETQELEVEDTERAPEAQTAETVADEHRRAPANPPHGPSTTDRVPASAAPTASRGPALQQTEFAESVRQALRSAELVPSDWQGDPVERIRALGVEVRDLRGWASIGESARRELVETIEAEGVRAYGEAGLPQNVYKRLLDTGSWEELTGLRDHLRSIARSRFPGGRVTSEEREQPIENVQTETEIVPDDTPDSVYRARY